MKTSNSKSAHAYKSTQAKTGFLTTNKIRHLLHINNTASATADQHSFQAPKLTRNEKEELSYEIEAELKKAQARTYANAFLIR